ncbi:uncharacterized protein LOC111405844 [Olea europaea var. sylvestris]|uniref:uncharacterized protein LOC111405844 n=1 Tax=Olea europaea var. sylvestris TaxID=158386 RepID=UPI000C1D3300|nr:uncharacterized protein LOC111405844 [Olea europaea var. sylvestris]
MRVLLADEMGLGKTLQSQCARKAGHGVITAKFDLKSLSYALVVNEVLDIRRCPGNSIQMSDGVGAVFLMKKCVTMQKGILILRVFRCLSYVTIFLFFFVYPSY